MTDHITLPRSTVEQAVTLLHEWRLQFPDAWALGDKQLLSTLRAALAGAAQAEPVAVPYFNRREVEYAIHCEENPTGMLLNDGKARVTLPGGTLRRMLQIIDMLNAAPTPPAATVQIPPGACASDWGGRETGKCLHTTEEVKALLASVGVQSC